MQQEGMMKWRDFCAVEIVDEDAGCKPTVSEFSIVFLQQIQ